MSDWIEINKDPAHVKREKEKARELRKTAWWQNEINKGTCHYCRKKFKAEELTMDHVVPLVRGGKSNKGNIVPACKDCNNKKKYKTPVDMILEELDKNGKSEETDQEQS